jgi:hypothetical protein
MACTAELAHGMNPKAHRNASQEVIRELKKWKVAHESKPKQLLLPIIALPDGNGEVVDAQRRRNLHFFFSFDETAPARPAVNEKQVFQI